MGKAILGEVVERNMFAISFMGGYEDICLNLLNTIIFTPLIDRDSRNSVGADCFSLGGE